MNQGNASSFFLNSKNLQNDNNIHFYVGRFHKNDERPLLGDSKCTYVSTVSFSLAWKMGRMRRKLDIIRFWQLISGQSECLSMTAISRRGGGGGREATFFHSHRREVALAISGFQSRKTGTLVRLPSGLDWVG